MRHTERITNKQFDILSCVRKGKPDGSFLDMDELLEGVTYETSTQSMQFSIRFLVNRGLVEKKPKEVRRGRSRAIYALTPKSYMYLGWEESDVVELE